MSVSNANVSSSGEERFYTQAEASKMTNVKLNRKLGRVLEREKDYIDKLDRMVAALQTSANLGSASEDRAAERAVTVTQRDATIADRDATIETQAAEINRLRALVNRHIDDLGAVIQDVSMERERDNVADATEGTGATGNAVDLGTRSPSVSYYGDSSPRAGSVPLPPLPLAQRSSSPDNIESSVSLDHQFRRIPPALATTSLPPPPAPRVPPIQSTSRRRNTRRSESPVDVAWSAAPAPNVPNNRRTQTSVPESIMDQLERFDRRTYDEDAAMETSGTSDISKNFEEEDIQSSGASSAVEDSEEMEQYIPSDKEDSKAPLLAASTRPTRTRVATKPFTTTATTRKKAKPKSPSPSPPHEPPIFVARSMPHARDVGRNRDRRTTITPNNLAEDTDDMQPGTSSGLVRADSEELEEALERSSISREVSLEL